MSMSPSAFDEKSFSIVFNNTSSLTVVFVTLSIDFVLFNNVIIYSFDDAKFFFNIFSECLALWKNSEFVDLSKKNWMRISFKSDWKNKILDKIKIYSLKVKDRAFVDQIFNKLHDLKRLFWINESTSFSYSMFCIWKNVNDERKKRVVVDIRELNFIIQFDVYFLSLQIKIISIVRNCSYIIVVNAFVFFYQ